MSAYVLGLFFCPVYTAQTLVRVKLVGDTGGLMLDYFKTFKC